MAFDRPLVALITYCEASNCTPEERRLIVHTIFNRAKQPKRFEPTSAGVVLQRFQYSEMNDDRTDNQDLERGANASDNDPVIQDCLAAFDEVAGGAPDQTGGATHFCNKDLTPNWATGATLALETEHFKFYRNVA